MIDRFGRFLVKFRQSKKYPVRHCTSFVRRRQFHAHAANHASPAGNAQIKRSSRIFTSMREDLMFLNNRMQKLLR